MASHKRQPKPKGESECSWPTATVPVTSFIDVMRNADQNRSRGSLCCSVRVRSSNADSASQASRELPLLADPAITGGYPVTTDEHPAITGGYPVIPDGPSVIPAKAGIQRGMGRRGAPDQDPNDRSSYPNTSSPHRRAGMATASTRG